VCPQPCGKSCRHPNAAPKRPDYPVPSPVRKSPSPSSMRQPLIQMGYRGDSGGGRWRRRWQSFTLTLDAGSG
jgi:hypothetical protein